MMPGVTHVEAFVSGVVKSYMGFEQTNVLALGKATRAYSKLVSLVNRWFQVSAKGTRFENVRYNSIPFNKNTMIDLMLTSTIRG